MILQFLFDYRTFEAKISGTSTAKMGFCLDFQEDASAPALNDSLAQHAKQTWRAVVS